jgi:hypothetical protein
MHYTRIHRVGNYITPIIATNCMTVLTLRCAPIVTLDKLDEFLKFGRVEI